VAEETAIGSILKWPDRLSKPSARASVINNGANLFEVDSQKWVRRVSYYKKSLGVKLGSTNIRNVMDMNAFFGGFAAAIISDPVWVMNVVPGQKPLTLGVIYDRGLIGVYHDWYESNSLPMPMPHLDIISTFLYFVGFHLIDNFTYNVVTVYLCLTLMQTYPEFTCVSDKIALINQ
jgi:hypothetical protein